MCDDSEELNDTDYLRDLSERIRNIPVLFGTDGYDVDRLWNMANKMQSLTQLKELSE